MISTLPLIADTHYDFTTTLGDVQFGFEVRWNSRDEAWYLDMYDADGVEMVMGMKIVLGTYLGRRSVHPWFAENVLAVIDTTLEERDAGFDDLGTRIQVRHWPVADLIQELTAL